VPHHGGGRQLSRMKAGGNLFCFDVAGDKEACFRFLDALRLLDIFRQSRGFRSRS